MKKTERIIFRYVLPVLFTAALTVTAVWGSAQKARAEEYFSVAGEYMGATYAVFDRCANELEDNVYDMQSSLAKLRVAASKTQCVLALEDIVSAGSSAVSVMSRLPRTHAATEELMKFLVRTGDYARCLSRRVLAGEALAGSDLDQLEALYETCTRLTVRLRTAVDNGEIAFDIMAPSGYYADDATDSESQTLLSSGAEQPSQSSSPSSSPSDHQGDNMNDSATADESIPEYPSLIYDGPFSESTEKAEAKGVTGEDVTMETALEAAQRLTGASLVPTGMSGGKIPVYTFESAEGQGNVAAAVTVTGGRLLWFMGETANETEGIPDDTEYEMLCQAGLLWLETAGYSGMIPTYAMYYNGMALISYVWQTGSVRVYNDLIKVWIERGTGRIVGADANNYLFSHRERRLPLPELAEEEALALASPRLEVDGVTLALIPLSPMTEALCYELHGYCGGEEYVVYINAVTGSEDRIFKIISDENGKAAV